LDSNIKTNADNISLLPKQKKEAHKSPDRHTSSVADGNVSLKQQYSIQENLCPDDFEISMSDKASCHFASNKILRPSLIHTFGY
jgi:hypothetical protein